MILEGLHFLHFITGADSPPRENLNLTADGTRPRLRPVPQPVYVLHFLRFCGIAVSIRLSVFISGWCCFRTGGKAYENHSDRRVDKSSVSATRVSFPLKAEICPAGTSFVRKSTRSYFQTGPAHNSSFLETAAFPVREQLAKMKLLPNCG